MNGSRWVWTALWVAVAMGALSCPWHRPTRADEPAPRPRPSWWATYAGIKTVTDDADDARNVVPLRSEGFFRKYPAAHQEVWKRHGVSSSTQGSDHVRSRREGG